MGHFYTEFIAFAKRRYPGLEATLEKIVAELGEDADIENLLARLNAGMSLGDALPPGFEAPETDAWQAHCSILRSHLLSYIVEMCEGFDRRTASTEIGALAGVITRHETAIFSTNYDRVVEFSFESAGLALDDGFDTSDDEPVAPWRGSFRSRPSLAKIHGSVTWYEEPDKPDAIVRLDRGYPLPGPDFHLSRQGQELRPLMIVPTLEKDALHRPYMHLFTYLSDVFSGANLLLTIGSSLRDDHLVEAIRARRETLCVVVTGLDSEVAAGRLHGVAAVPFEIATKEFLSLPEDVLEELFAVRHVAVLADRAETARRIAERSESALLWCSVCRSHRRRLLVPFAEMSRPPFSTE